MPTSTSASGAAPRTTAAASALALLLAAGAAPAAADPDPLMTAARARDLGELASLLLQTAGKCDVAVDPLSVARWEVARIPQSRYRDYRREADVRGRGALSPEEGRMSDEDRLARCRRTIVVLDALGWLAAR